MGYRVYHKCFCDIPGCEGRASDDAEKQISMFNGRPRERKNGDVSLPMSWHPGSKARQEPYAPSGWRYESAGIYGLWICPKHKVEATIDGQSVKDVLEDRETYYKLRGQP